MTWVRRLAAALTAVKHLGARVSRSLARFAGERARPYLSATSRGTEQGTISERPRRRLSWSLRLLLAASLAVPALLLAFAAWQNFRLVQIQAEQRIMIGTGQLHEHVLSALETYALVLAWVDDRIHGLNWEQIEHDDSLHRFLADIETLPEVGTVSIIDAAGHVRASGHPLADSETNASSRDAFIAQTRSDAGVYLAREFPDQSAGTADFDVSRRRSTPDGSFDGVIMVSAKPNFFTDFFSMISRNENFSALLVRRDGVILIRYPTLPIRPFLTPDRPVMQVIGRGLDQGVFRGDGKTDGVMRLFGYERVGGYPLYVAFGIPTRAVLASWSANLVDYLLFAVPASFGLFFMTLFAVRQLQRQKIATWRWQRTAGRLEREMNRRTRAEADLHQAQKMEALGQLTGGVAHDFNNLLTVLQGCLELLSGRQQDPKLEARVDMALRTIERAERLTGQLLAFARRQPLTVTRVDLNQLLHGMSELLARTVGSGIKVETDFAADLWPVDVDATQLELAVINLAINARDAMPNGGVLTVRTFNTASPRQLSTNGPSGREDFVGLEISDTGTGMTPEVLARAFEPLFTTKGPTKGTGLGLSIVYGFARQSGGWAEIRSELEHGTSVTLFFPRGKVGETAETRVSDLPLAG